MIESGMLSGIERLLHSALIDHYPEWTYAQRVVGLGRRIRFRLASFRFDASLLEIDSPSLVTIVRSSYADARGATLMTYNSLVKAFARGAFEDCYFLHRADSEDFYRVVFFPRFLFSLAQSTVKGMIPLLFEKHDYGLSNWVLQQISLGNYYGDPAASASAMSGPQRD